MADLANADPAKFISNRVATVYIFYIFSPVLRINKKVW